MVCVPLCVRVFRVSRVCPGSPRCLFTGSRYVFERGFTHSSHLRTHATGTDARNAPDAGEEPRTDTGRSKEATYGCAFLRNIGTWL